MRRLASSESHRLLDGGVPAEDIARALRDMLREKHAETRAFFSMIASLTSTLDLPQLLKYALHLCAAFTDCHGAFVYLWDDKRERLVVRAALDGYEEWVDRLSLELGEGLTGWTALTRRPGIIKENSLADPRYKYIPELQEERFQSILTVPILANDALLGVITIHSVAPWELDEDDLALMDTLSSLIAPAVENAQLYDRQSRQMSFLQLLAEGGHSLAQPSSLNRTLYRLAEAAASGCSADACALLTVDADGSQLALEVFWSSKSMTTALHAAKTFPASGPWARLLGATSPLILTDREHLDGLAQLDLLERPLRMALVAPLRAGDRILGLFVCLAVSANSFGREDMRLVSIVAAQTALTMQNARLIQALTERDVVGDLFRALRAGEEGDVGLETRGCRLGADLTRPHVVAMFSAEADTAAFDADRVWVQLYRDLHSTFPNSLFTHRDEHLTTVLRVADSSALPALAQRLSALKAPHEACCDVRLSVGMSGICRSVEEYPAAFEQAEQALQMGHAARGAGAVVTFKDLGAQWHLFNAARQGVRDTYQTRLEHLMEYDRQRGTDLFETLHTYLEHMGNSKLAAEELFIHRNTLRQRLRTIRKVAEVDPLDTRQWFDIMIAARILQLRQLGGARDASHPHHHVSAARR